MARFIERTGVDEIIISAAIYDPEARCRSLELVKEALSGEAR
jgi:hypothetical protein